MPVEHVISAVQEWKQRKPLYDLYRNYYRGQHELKFATKDFQRKHGATFKSLRENLCKSVVTAHTDRIDIESWGDDEAVDEARDQGMTRLAGMVHREVFRCGDAYTLTWLGVDGTPKARFHRADQIIPHVDQMDPDRLDWAAKLWVEGDVGRVNVYYTDRVERFVTAQPLTGQDANADHSTFPEQPGAWIAHSDDDGPDLIRHDFGAVPVCWWRLDADDNEGYGNSALSDVVPLQDGLNKGLADLLVLSETYARPFWYLLNFQPDTANPLTAANQFAQATAALPTQQRKFNPGEQQIYAHDGPGPFGQLDPPDLMRLIEQQREMKNKIATVAGIPAYYFSQTSAQVPSGESLRVLSSRLIAAVKDFTNDATPVWRGQAQLLGMGDNAGPRWADAMPMDETERITNAVSLKGLGFTLEDVVSYLGFGDAEGIVERASQAAEQDAAAVGRGFMNGTIGNTGYAS